MLFLVCGFQKKGTFMVTQTTTASNIPEETQDQVRLNQRFLIILALLILYVVWGTTYLGIRLALESYPPYLMMGIRFTIAGGALFAFLKLRGAATPTLKQWRSATIVGVLLLVGGMGSVALAEQSVSSGLAATLVASAPLWALLFSMRWGAKPARTEWIGVALGIFGVALLSLEGNLQANPVGVALVVFATVSWSLGSVWSRHLDMPAGGMGNAAEMLVGGIVLLVLGLLRREQIVGVPTTNAVLALAYLTTFGSLLTMTAYMYLLKTVHPTLATSYAFVNPAIALFLGVLIGGELLTGSVYIALPVILLGVAFVALRKK